MLCGGPGPQIGKGNNQNSPLKKSDSGKNLGTRLAHDIVQSNAISQIELCFVFRIPECMLQGLSFLDTQFGNFLGHVDCAFCHQCSCGTLKTGGSLQSFFSKKMFKKSCSAKGLGSIQKPVPSWVRSARTRNCASMMDLIEVAKLIKPG